MKSAMLASLLTVAVVFGLAPMAQAQQIVGDNVTANVQASWNTANHGTMALRSPGRVVTRARADFNDVHSGVILRSRFGPDITEQAPELTLEQQVRIQVLTTLFQNLNAAIVALNQAISSNAGLPSNGGTGTATNLSDLLGIITGPGS